MATTTLCTLTKAPPRDAFTARVVVLTMYKDTPRVGDATAGAISVRLPDGGVTVEKGCEYEMTLRRSSKRKGFDAFDVRAVASSVTEVCTGAGVLVLSRGSAGDSAGDSAGLSGLSVMVLANRNSSVFITLKYHLKERVMCAGGALAPGDLDFAVSAVNQWRHVEVEEVAAWSSLSKSFFEWDSRAREDLLLREDVRAVLVAVAQEELLRRSALGLQAANPTLGAKMDVPKGAVDVPGLDFAGSAAKELKEETGLFVDAAALRSTTPLVLSKTSSNGRFTTKSYLFPAFLPDLRDAAPTGEFGDVFHVPLADFQTELTGEAGGGRFGSLARMADPESWTTAFAILEAALTERPVSDLPSVSKDPFSSLHKAKTGKGYVPPHLRGRK